MSPAPLLLAAALAADGPDSGAAAPDFANRHVLFLGLDGVRTDALAAADTPHLDRLTAAGTVSETCRILPERFRDADTSSGPGWSSILCGVWADKHGVLDNAFRVKRYDRYPHWFARLKEARPDARTASYITWDPIAEHIVSAADVSRSLKPTDDGEDATSLYALGDARVCAEAVREIGGNAPTAVVAYLGQVDEAGHAHGFHPTVPQYTNAITRVDAHVGTLLAVVDERRAAGEEWLVVATTDHGGRGTGHGGSHEFEEVTTVWLLVSGDGATAGDAAEPTAIVDLVPTALTYLGVEIDPAWELDGAARGL